MPKKGYGQGRKLALYLGVHTTLVSQVLQGPKVFTLEQAASTAEFLGLTELETEYFLGLVQLERAGNEALRKTLRRQLQNLRDRSRELSERLQGEKVLGEEQKARFYSDWVYSAIRQMVAVPGHGEASAIAISLGLPLPRVNEALEFLLRAGLVKEARGQLETGPQSTHLESSSPWVRVHHLNWREKAIEALSTPSDRDLHYTAPMTLSVADFLKVRELIAQLLQTVDQVVIPSPSEQLGCLTIDWFSVGSARRKNRDQQIKPS